MAKSINLIGKRFQRLVVTGIAPKIGKVKKWLCICDCGAKHSATTSNLVRGKVRSCGCMQREQLGNMRRKHGASDTPAYNRWKSMVGRCTLKSHKSYPRYGGRGISVCDRWLSYENFLSDMGACPGPGYTIERKDNDLGYGPKNCIWATRTVQNRNTSSNRLIDYQGERLCVTEWAEILGIKARTVFTRLNKGWSVDKALGTPVRPQKPRVSK